MIPNTIRPAIRAVLDQPLFNGRDRPTLRDVLRAFRDGMEGDDADEIRRHTGMPLEDCERVASAAGAVLFCEEL